MFSFAELFSVLVGWLARLFTLLLSGIGGGILALALCLSGCGITGAGSFRIGMTNSNYVELGTDVDGDKSGKKASLSVDDRVMARLFSTGAVGDGD